MSPRAWNLTRPADSEKQTNFSGVPVTIIHCSLPYGPFDPDSYAPTAFITPLPGTMTSTGPPLR